MRTFSPPVLAQVAAKQAIPRRIFRLHLDSGDLCYTDHTSDLVFQGVTYHARKISPGTINTYMGKQADSCPITIDDVDGQVTGYAEAEDFEGRKAEVWQVFLDSNLDIIDGTKNLLSANQASVETDLTGFSGDGTGTITRDTSKHLDGNASLKFVTPSFSDRYVNILGNFTAGALNYLWACAYGQTRSFSANVFSDGLAQVSFRIIEFDSTGHVLVDHLGVQSTTAAAWTRLVWDGFTPSNVNCAGVLLRIQNSAGYGTMYFDALQWQNSDHATTFGLPTSDDKIVQFSGTMDMPVSGTALSIAIKNTCNRPKSMAPRRFWMMRCNNQFCDTDCTYNGSTEVSGIATSGATTSLTSSQLVGIASMIGARLVIVDGTNKGYWRKIKTHNTGTGAITFNAFTVAIDATSKFILDCDKLKSSCIAFGNQAKFSGFAEKMRAGIGSKQVNLIVGPVNVLSTGSMDGTPIASDSSPIALAYGLAQVSAKLIAEGLQLVYSYAAHTRIYGICSGEISAINDVIIRDQVLSSATRANTHAYQERLGTAGQSVQKTDFGGSGYYWSLPPSDIYYFPNTAFIAIRDVIPLANVVADNYSRDASRSVFTGDIYGDTVKVNIQGLKVQRYNADGSANGSPAFSRNPIWCMLDYMMKRAQEPYLASEIDFGVAYTSATLCDTLGYTMNLVLSEQKSDDEILTLMRNSCRAYFTFPSGRVAINIEHIWSGDAAHYFDDLSNGKTLGNIEPGSIKPYKRSKDQIYNRVIVKYIDEEERQNLAVLSADLATGTTTISYQSRQGTFGASGTAGTLYIGGEAVTYTGSTHNTDGTGNFTGCSARANNYDYGYPLFQGSQTFPDRTAIAYDEPNQRALHQVNQLDIDGTCIGTYRQAFAMATWYVKKSIYGNQNVKFRGFREALGLTVGDQNKLTFKKRGWVDWKFRIIGMSEGPDNKIDFDCELYEDSFYPELMGTASVPNTTILPSPFEAPDQVTGVTLAEGGLAGTDGTYVPALTVSYTLPTDSRYWDHSIVQVKINSGPYMTVGNDYSSGVGYNIDGVKAGYTKSDTVVKVISVNQLGIPADADAAPTASRAIAASIITLVTPTGLTLEGGGTSWNGRKFAVSWDPQGAGSLDPSYISYEVEIWTGGVDRLLVKTKDCRYEYVYGDGSSSALDSYMVIANGSVTIKVRRVSPLAASSAQATISLTQVAPQNPQNVVIQALPRGASLTWDKNTESDFKEYQIRTKVTSGGTFSTWTPIQDNTFVRTLTATEIGTYGKTPSIYFEVKTRDMFNNDSSATAANVVAIYYGITNLDVDDISADKITVGSLTGIGIYGSAHATKGSYLTASSATDDTTVNVKDTTSFSSSGSGWIIDSSNDKDEFFWTGKTSATLTGCSGVQAHTVSSSNVPIVLPETKAIVIADCVNELRVFSDLGNGIFGETAHVGASNVGTDLVVGSFGHDNFAGYGVKGNAALGGIFGDSPSGYGLVGRCGASWALIQRLGAETIVYSLVSLGGGVVIAGTSPNGKIYRSTNSGASWTLVQQLGTEANVSSLVSLGGGVVIAGTAPTGRIYRSTDSGASWTLVQQLGTEINVYSLVSLGGGVVIAGTASSCLIYRSTDSGASWTFVNRLGTETKVSSLVSLGSGVVIAGTSGGIYRSTNSGASWTFVQQLGTSSLVYSLVSLGSGVVLAGTTGGGNIYRSTNSGASWTLVQQLGTETDVYSLVSLGGGVVLAGTVPSGRIYRSTDSGASWTLVLRLGTETYIYSLVSLGGGVVMAGTYPTGQIYLNINSGTSGKAPLKLTPDIIPTAPVHSADKGSFWLTSNGVLYINTDGGTTWKTSLNAGMKESADFTIAISTPFSFAHGFGVRPTLYKAVIRCVTAEYGYVAGDEVEAITYSTAANYTGGGVYANATYVGFVVLAGLSVGRIDTQVKISITPANWKLVLRAWL